MNCVLPVLLVLICLTFTKQEDSVGKRSNEIVINNQTEELPNSDIIDIGAPIEPTDPTPTTTNTVPTTPVTKATTLTPSPNSTTTLTPSPNGTTTIKPSSTTASTTTKPPPPTTKTSTISPPTTTKPTISPPTTTSTVAPTTSTVAPTTSTASPEHHRRFDGPSFVGGIVLALGLVAIGFVAFKFYKARIEVNYHTL